jgi:hypothetical protein
VKCYSSRRISPTSAFARPFVHVTDIGATLWAPPLRMALRLKHRSYLILPNPKSVFWPRNASTDASPYHAYRRSGGNHHYAKAPVRTARRSDEHVGRAVALMPVIDPRRSSFRASHAFADGLPLSPPASAAWGGPLLIEVDAFSRSGLSNTASNTFSICHIRGKSTDLNHRDGVEPVVAGGLD